MTRLPPITGVLGALFVAALVALAADRTASALPMYAQRSGRTCANCHVSPTLESPEGWDNPRLAERKCTLSCVACHVNPTGGGMRNASGRYYGQSTLSVYHTQDRSYTDLQKELLSDEQLYRFQQKFGDEAADLDGDGRFIPSVWSEVLAGVGAAQRGNWTSAGKPVGGPTKMAFWDGRYDDLNADPLLSVGGDIRAAYWSGTNTIFPMQVDLDAALHPVEHVTVMATAAARGRSSGVEDVARDPRSPVFARDAFVMIHELPYFSWAKAGIFLPSFGTYIDDHTAFTREFFEMDPSKSEDTVLGVELGTAPNYPFATASVFRDQVTAADADPGWGSALNFGYRDLGWSLTGHAMVKQRGGAARGDLVAGGVAWGFNPAYYQSRLPITLTGELTLGQRTIDGAVERPWALMQEAWWTPWNGVSVRGRMDLGSLDASAVGSLQQRTSLGLEVSPIPGLTMTGTGRVLTSPGSGSAASDVFVQTHIWF